MRSFVLAMCLAAGLVVAGLVGCEDRANEEPEEQPTPAEEPEEKPTPAEEPEEQPTPEEEPEE